MAMVQNLAEDEGAIYRSGVAARLAGLSPQTLRVWERRYNLSEAKRSPRGQRMYSAEQVRRLRLLKQLVDQGHAIGALATLTIGRLEELVGGGLGVNHCGSRPVRMALVGAGLMKRVALSLPTGSEFIVQHSWQRLSQVAPPDDEVPAELLLIEQSELDEHAMAAIAAAQQAVPGAATLVLYRFCASATIRALRAQGCLVARMPSEFDELLVLCRAALKGERLPRNEPAPAPGVRFDEEQLAALAAHGNKIRCECPRHLADLLLMVNSFERYSAQCASRDEDDARLHRDLQRAAGLARSTLEEAMEKLLRAEGLPVPPPAR